MGQWHVAREALPQLRLPLVLQQVLEVDAGDLVELLIFFFTASLSTPGSSMAIGAVDETRLVSIETNCTEASMCSQVGLILGERTT